MKSGSHPRNFDIILISFAILSVSVLLVDRFWVYPIPSDPLQYVNFGVLRAGLFEWFDRITLVIGLQIAALLPIARIDVAPTYGLFVSIATLVILCTWAYRRVGFTGSIFVLFLTAPNYYFLEFASQIYPEPTIVLWNLLAAFILFEARNPENARSPLLIGGGAVLAIATFTKATTFPIPILVLWLLGRENDWKKKLLSFLTGYAVGIITLVTLFILLFGYQKMTVSLAAFFGNSIALNYHGRVDYNNLVTYLDGFTNKIFHPVFLALLAFASIYRDPRLRPIALFSWTFVFSITFIYAITNRGFEPILNYIYPAYPFATLTIAIHLASVASFAHRGAKAALLLGLIATMTLGLIIGLKYNPAALFAPGIIDLPRPLGVVLSLSALLTLLGLGMTEFFKIRRLATGFVFLSVFWLASYSGGQAFQRMKYNKTWNTAYKYFLPTINHVDAVHVNAYVEAWTAKNAEIDRINRVYGSFFVVPFVDSAGKSHHRTVGGHTDIAPLRHSREGKILTDVPNKVMTIAPNYTVEKDFLAPNGLRLYVLARRGE